MQLVPSLLALALAVAARAACPGYKPIKDEFKGGQTYIMDVNEEVANPNVWDWNTTKIFYGKFCETDRPTTHEVSFVTLDDCAPVPSRYLRLPEMDRNFIQGYFLDANNPRIDVQADKEGVARFPCYTGGLATSYKYELHYRGWHRSAFLDNLGYYDKVISSP